MTSKKQTRGQCHFCGKEMTKTGLTKHFSACSKYQEGIASAGKKTENEQIIYHLVIQDKWRSAYWLHLEMKSSAKLKDMDSYLRAIWLECCGHLSQFSIGGWGGGEISMNSPVNKVFQKGVELTHIYDFGDSSETLVKVVSERKGKPFTKHPIFLMARNEMPQETCIECNKPATCICMECRYEDGSSGFLCNTHAQEHPHDNYGEPMELVNSPRFGQCGYDGPAEPPY